ncbi:MAG: hypothetical protein HYX92_07235 [Chloroflexi bacterium]|nr:hypothetical protein [Chloroflexota bacterium]
MALERKGVPTVTMVHDRFVPAARAQARVLNLPDLRIASVPQPMPWETADDERKKADNVLGTLVNMLTEPVPQTAKS